MGRKDERVDAYIGKAAKFAHPVLNHLRALYHEACPEVEETIKWGSPHFDHKGMLGGIAAFKHHVSLGFWKASLMQDEHGLLKDSGTQMSAIKITGMDELPADEVIVYYIRQGADLNERGVKLPVNRSREKQEIETPEDLQKALDDSAAARDTWEGFSYSNRRDYLEWITGAKQDATRENRLTQAIVWMAEGKPRNWKYMKKYQV